MSTKILHVLYTLDRNKLYVVASLICGDNLKQKSNMVKNNAVNYECEQDQQIYYKKSVIIMFTSLLTVGMLSSSC